MAAFLLQPHVTEFLDVVMRDRSIELRWVEVTLACGSPLVGQSLRQAQVREHTGALVLALRHVDGTFLTNPDPDTELVVGQILIAIGTDAQLRSLVAAAASPMANPAAQETGDPASASSSRSHTARARPSSQGEVGDPAPLKRSDRRRRGIEERRSP